ncbi:hypothetical protein GGR57DRAFT_20858 [Xylariaceae sp. FL1272]|nr:hypothetical protein GGR57DRAFT_20858 [Xylariaceae sp. FL1272]
MSQRKPDRVYSQNHPASRLSETRPLQSGNGFRGYQNARQEEIDTGTVSHQHLSQEGVGSSSGGHQHSQQRASGPHRDRQHAHREKTRTDLHRPKCTQEDEGDIDTHAHQLLQQEELDSGFHGRQHSHRQESRAESGSQYPYQGETHSEFRDPPSHGEEPSDVIRSYEYSLGEEVNTGQHGHLHLHEKDNVALLGAKNAQRDEPNNPHAHQHVHQDETRGELRSYTPSHQSIDGKGRHEHQHSRQGEIGSPSRGHAHSHQRRTGRNEELVRSLIQRYENQVTSMASATPSSFADDITAGPLQPVRLHQGSGGAMASGHDPHTDDEQKMASSFSQRYESDIAIPTPIAPSSHECFWRERYLTLTAEIRQLKAEMSTMASNRSADLLSREEHYDDVSGLRAVTTILHFKDKDDIVVNTDLSQ